jgi:hypothetical protein
MALDIKSAKNISQDARLKMLVYGDSGVGKTVFASGFPKPFVIASEEGLLSVAGQDVDYVSITSWAQLEEIYLHLLKTESKKTYQSVVVDSFTTLQQLALAYVLEQNGRQFPEQRDWGMLLELMRRFMRQMADLPYHIVFICLSGTEKDDLTGIVREKPSIVGRMAAEAPAYVDVVMHLTVEMNRKGGEVSVTRFGIFQPSSRAVAKDRSGRLPTVMKEPTASKVIAKVRGDVVEKPPVRRRRSTTTK